MLFGTYLLSWNLLGLFSMRIMDTYCSFDVVDDLEVPVPSEENDAVDLELALLGTNGAFSHWQRVDKRCAITF